MSAASVTFAPTPNRTRSETGTLIAQSGRVIGTFRNLFPQHARKTLARLFDLSEGAAEKKLNGQRDLSLDEFCALLRTESGFHYLTTVMADAQVKWWRICVPLMEVAEVQAMQIAARRRLARAVKGALDADAVITAAHARADALLVQDEDFHRAHADALRAAAGVPDRTGVTANRKR